MASRSEAHETSSLLFVRDGVLPAYICNNFKEMIQGNFEEKLKDAVCHLKQLEPYTAWSDAAERDIKSLRKGASSKLVWSRVPKCLEFEPYIWSNTAQDIYKLDGEVCRTVMSGKTSDNSQLCKLECCKWVMFEMKLPHSQMMC